LIISSARDVLGEVRVHRLAGLDEGVLVGFVDLHAGLLHFDEIVFVHLGRGLEHEGLASFAVSSMILRTSAGTFGQCWTSATTNAGE